MTGVEFIAVIGIAGLVIVISLMMALYMLKQSQS